MAMNGMFVCPKRVERNGYLVAFEGEVMTMDEAANRGLVQNAAEPEKKPRARKGAAKR